MRLKSFLGRYAKESEAKSALARIRRKFDAAEKKCRSGNSQIGASSSEIREWARQMVARREKKKGKNSRK